MSTDDLATLFAAPREVTIAGRRLQLTAITFEELHRVAEIGKPVLQLFVSNPASDVPKMLREHAATVVTLCAVLSHQPRDWAAALPAGQLIKLFNACVEVNADFFTDGMDGLISLAKQFGFSLTKSSSPNPSPSQAPSQIETPSDLGSGSPAS